MKKIGDHAIVIGGSMAGLLAARALSEAYGRVTVLDRDALPPIGQGRRSVPQGRHAHALLPGGQREIEDLLPGFAEELVAAGAHRYRLNRDFRFSPREHELARFSSDIEGIVASRPFIEGHVRRRIAALPNVEIIDRCDVAGLMAAADGSRIVGVRTKALGGDAEVPLDADIVLAATGRSARIPGWLQSLGYDAPEEKRLTINLKYASRELALGSDAFAGDRIIVYGARPGLPRTFALTALEGGRWLLTLGGYGDHAPPSDPDAFMRFAATVVNPDLMAAIRDAEPLSEIATHRFPANVRRRYERLRRFPDGLLVAGDAICSFNPLYGQGMSVAALEAAALRRCLEEGERKLPQRFFKAAGKVVDLAWTAATGADLSLPEVEGHRPLGVRAVNRYIARVQATAAADPAVAEAFMRVVGMLEPPTHVLRPATAMRVLRHEATPKLRRQRSGRASAAPTAREGAQA